MATQTTWDKAQGLALAQSRQSSAATASAPRRMRDHASFYLVFVLLTAVLCAVLWAVFNGTGLTWRSEFALWAAVPACALTVLTRFITRKHLGG